MHPKIEMLASIAATWSLAALSCAALPFMHAIPQLKAVDEFAPLYAALVIGLVGSFLLDRITRRLCGLDASRKNTWGPLSPGAAATLGIVAWGVPVGLIFAVNHLLSSSDIFVIWSLLIWSVAGVAFGLMMRWLGRRSASPAS